MAKYTVAISGEEDTAQTTSDLDAALDWFTNACTAVMDPEDEIRAAIFKVDGVTCGWISENGPPGEGEVVELNARRVA